jgi:hypothetical protein
MVRNAPKYEFWAKWSSSVAFVAENLDATTFSKLGR